MADPNGDMRVLRLTNEEEKKLLARLENIADFSDLKNIEGRVHAQLGIVIRITPSIHEVRTTRGISIEVAERPGLCRKTRQNIPAAIRRSLEKNPDIAYAILNAHDLLGGT